jgi:hypothetical protein
MPGPRAVTGQPRWKSDGAGPEGGGLRASQTVGDNDHRPVIRLFGVAVAYAKRLQSGRLDAYLLYMLIALVTVTAVVAALA